MQKTRANQIISKALKTRKTIPSVGYTLPVCPYVLAESLGLDIRFVNIPSFEGMYVASTNLILIASDRPEGRKRFTCAHEIGHHILGHGTVIDEMIEQGSDKEIEKEADLFASFLLMPSSAVKSLINECCIEQSKLEKKDIYVLSKYFGVSYLAFLSHLYFSLKFINQTSYYALKENKLQTIRDHICPITTKNQVFKVGKWWKGKTIDMEVGDIICLDMECEIDGSEIISNIRSNRVFEAVTSGITRIYDQNGWASFVTISRKNYSGRVQYRHEEEIE